MDSKIFSHFKSADPLLFELMNVYPPVVLERSANPFLSLCREIINQQLSAKAGGTITGRFMALFAGESITATDVLAIPQEKLRTVGMSWSKAKFLHNIAQAVIDGSLNFTDVAILPEDDVMKELTKIKGIGPWTAEMFLMFSLGREDVFSVGDVGLQRAIQNLYKLKKKPTKKQMLKISSKWKPYRTYACRVLWDSLDNK